MSESIFRQKGEGAIPRGVENKAEGANPSELSGGAAQPPVWKQFVGDADFQKENAGAIAAEKDRQRDANRSAFKGGNGKLLRRVPGGGAEMLNAEDWVNDPVAGPEARRSVWDRDARATRKEAEDIDFRLKDPSFHARGLTKTQRAEIEAEGGSLPESNPRHAELKKRLIDDDAYQAEKRDLAQRSYDAQARARAIEETDPETWWQQRQQKPADPQQEREQKVATVQQQRQQADVADEVLAQREKQLQEKRQQGVRGSEIESVNTELAEVSAERGRIAQERTVADQQIEQIRREASDQTASGKDAPGREIAARFIGTGTQAQKLSGNNPGAYESAKGTLNEIADQHSGISEALNASGGDIDKAIAYAEQQAAKINVPVNWNPEAGDMQADFLGQGSKYAGASKQLAAMKAEFDAAGIDPKDRPRIIKDAALSSAWTSNDADNLRKLSTGELVINPGRVFGNRETLIAEINATDASDANKRAAVEALDAMRDSMANQVYSDSMTAGKEALVFDGFVDFAKQAEAKGMSRAAILDEWSKTQKDRNWLFKSANAIAEGVHTGQMGIGKTMLGTVAGISALVGADGTAQNFGQAQQLLVKGIERQGSAAELRGLGGGYKIARDLTNTVGQMAPMFAGGGIGNAIKGISGGIVQGMGVYGWSAAQGYESKLADAVEMAAEKKGSKLTGDEIAAVLGEGKTQTAAMLNGFQTAILAKVLGGGAERAALGKAAKSLTVADFVRRGGAKALKDGVLRTELKAMAKTVLADASDEGVEEFFNQVLDSAISTAVLDKEMKLGDLLEESFIAGTMGAVVGAALPQFNSTPKEALDAKATMAKITNAVAAVDPEAPAPTEEEANKAAAIAHPEKGEEGVADAVLIERELAEVEAQDDQAAADASANVEAIRATGDTKATKAAEEQAESITPRAPLVRATLKIAGGKQIDDLTADELAAVGLEVTQTGFKPVKDAEVMIRPGADGSIIITDGALKKVRGISTRAADQISMSESEAIQKAKERAAKASAGPEAIEGAGVGSPASPSGLPEYDVPMRDGTMLRVSAADPDAALQEAAAQAPISGRPAVAVAPANSGSTPANSGSSPANSGSSTPSSNPAKPALPGFPKGVTNEKTIIEVLDGEYKGRHTVIGMDTKGDVHIIGKSGYGEKVEQGNWQISKDQKSPANNLPNHPRVRPMMEDTRRERAAVRKIFDAAKKKLGDRIIEGDERAATRPDGIVISLQWIIDEALAAGMTGGQAVEYFRRILDEEIRHLAQYDAAKLIYRAEKRTEPFLEWMDAHYSQIWENDFVATGKADSVRDIYAKGNKAAETHWDGAMRPADKALEAIRIMSQGDKVTEAAKLWLNISDTLAKALRAALHALKQFKGIISTELESEIANLENALRALQQSPANPADRNEKPAPGKKGSGTGKSAEGERDSSTPRPSETESPPSNGSVSPFAVGSKVEFTKDGKTQTGTVSFNPGTGFLRVRPDSDPAISYVVRADESREIAPAPAAKESKDGWEAFPADSGTLGIPRAEMPQIKAGDRAAAVQFLRARGMDYVETELDADDLKPTQAEFSPEKVQKAKAYEGGNRSIIISGDGYVIDGHHQWLAAKDARGQARIIQAIRIKAPSVNILEALKQMPSVETSDESGKSTAAVILPAPKSFEDYLEELAPGSDIADDQLPYYDQIEHDIWDRADPDTQKKQPQFKKGVLVGVENPQWMAPEDAKAKIEEWKAQAKADSANGNSGKIVLSLFDSTGVWSQPWEDAGYTVYRIDLDPDSDVAWQENVQNLTAEFMEDNGLDMVDVVLAQPPCTDFSLAGNRWFHEPSHKAEKEAGLAKNTDLVNHTLDLIGWLRPLVWSIENPIGTIKKHTNVPEPRLVFDPFFYGDDYTKRTQIFGLFNENLPEAMVFPEQGSRIHNLRGDDPAQKKLRSLTPEGFAYAYYMANRNYGEWSAHRAVDMEGEITPEELARQAAKRMYESELNRQAAGDDPIKAEAARAELARRQEMRDRAEDDDDTDSDTPDTDPDTDETREETPEADTTPETPIAVGSWVRIAEKNDEVFQVLRIEDGRAYVDGGSWGGYPVESLAPAEEPATKGKDKRNFERIIGYPLFGGRKITSWPENLRPIIKLAREAFAEKDGRNVHALRVALRFVSVIERGIQGVAFKDLANATSVIAAGDEQEAWGEVFEDRMLNLADRQTWETIAKDAKAIYMAASRANTITESVPEKSESIWQPIVGEWVSPHAWDKFPHFDAVTQAFYQIYRLGEVVASNATDEQWEAAGFPKSLNNPPPDITQGKRDTPVYEDENGYRWTFEPILGRKVQPDKTKNGVKVPLTPKELWEKHHSQYLTLDEIEEIHKAAREKQQAEDNPTPAAEPSNGEWTADVQKQYRKLKTALNKAIKAKNWPKVLEEAKRGLEYFEANAYPDDWSTWERAKDDAEMQIRLAKPAVDLSAAEKELGDILDGLFAAPLPDQEYDRAIPPDKMVQLATWAMKYRLEGIETPEQLAGRLAVIYDGRIKPFSQKLWYGFKMTGSPGPAEPDWSAIYGEIDNEANDLDTTNNSEGNDNSDRRGSGGTPDGNGSEESPQEGDGNGDLQSGGEGSDEEDPPEDAVSGSPGGRGGRGGRRKNPRGGGNAGGQPDQQGEADGNSGSDGVDGGTDARPEPRHVTRAEPGTPEANFRITDDFAMPQTARERIAANLDAISLLRVLENEERDATAEEKTILSKYSGWGSFKESFNTINQQNWEEMQQRIASSAHWQSENIRNSEEYAELEGWRNRHGALHDQLKEILDETEFRSMAKSVMNAHYTNLPIIDSMWNLAERLGFKGGNVLETSVGGGYFIGRQPESLAEKSNWSAVELDEITSRVVSKLYPEIRVNGSAPDGSRLVSGQGFQDSKIPNNSQDLIIGNFPFHRRGPGASEKEFGMSMNLHNYFFARSISKLKPGGLVIAITSASTMDNNLAQREILAGRAELVAAIRLPNTAFKGSAGTEVTTDIIVLRKKDGTVSPHAKSWLNTVEIGGDTVTFKRGQREIKDWLAEIPADYVPVEESLRETWADWSGNKRPKSGKKWDALIAALTGYVRGNGMRGANISLDFNAPIYVNEYFQQHPEMALGRHALTGSMYSANEYTLEADGRDLAAAINGIAETLPADVLGTSLSDHLGKLTKREADAGDREGSSVERDGNVYQVVKGELIPIRWDVEYMEETIRSTGIFKDRKALSDQFDEMRDQLDPDRTRAFIERMMEELLTPQERAAYEAKVAKELEKRMTTYRSWSAIRDAAIDLVNAEQGLVQVTDAKLEDLRKKLNETYDAHVKKYKAINVRRANPLKFLAADQDAPLVESLEDEEVEGLTEKGDPIYRYVKRPIFTERVLQDVSAPESAESVEEGIGISLGFAGRIDVPYIARLTSKTVQEVERELSEKELAFVDPETGIYELADLYLSGEVHTKLRRAEEADKYNPGQYQANIKALEKVQPKHRPIHAISIVLGARWISNEVYTQFVADALAESYSVKYIKEANLFRIEEDPNVIAGPTTDESQAIGTDRVTAIKILDAALNMRRITVRNRDGDVMPQATEEANAKVDLLRDKFSDWAKTGNSVLTIGSREVPISEVVEEDYNEKVSGVVPPNFKGDWITLPGQSGEIFVKNRPHRRSVLARLILSGFGMMAHGVGSGKTYNQIALAMEMRRLGKAKKPMILVQNSTIRQFAASFMKAYPQARILVADSENFSSRKRARFQARVATGDYDAIILTHSNVSLIGHSEQSIRQYMARALDELDSALRDAADGSQEQRDIQTARDNLIEKLNKMLEKATSRAGSMLTWEQLGVDALIVDEAHEFKNTPVVTRMSRVKNLPTGQGSDRAVMMQMKVASVQARNDGKNVFFATGTPITNTMAEAYTMLQYIAPRIMENRGINNFDDFATMFGRTVSDAEATWKGEIENVERFAKFVNGPELINLVRTVFDVALGNDNLGLRVPKMRGGKPRPILIEPTEANEIFNDWVIDTAAEFAAIPNKKQAFADDPWMSAIPIMTMQAGMAQAIDPRLINPDVPDEPDSKVNKMVDEIVKIYEAGNDRKTAQVVFSDLSNPFSTMLLRRFNGDPFEEYTQDSPRVREMAVLEQAIAALGKAEQPGEKQELKALLKRYNALVEQGFSLYDDIKKKLVARNIPASEIFIASSDVTRDKLQPVFDKVNDGRVRIIMGSTARLGVGVNIQERLAALHHLSPPRDFKPAMMEQRNGRIIRQGNLLRDWADEAFVDVVERLGGVTFSEKRTDKRFKQAEEWLAENDRIDTASGENISALAELAAEKFSVDVITYGLKFSMDSAVYSMMGAKQGFIEQILMGENIEDEFDDPASEEVAGFAMMAAETMGDEDLKSKVALEFELKKIKAERNAHNSDTARIKNDVRTAKMRLTSYENEDLDAVMDIGARYEGAFQKVKRTVKTTKGAIAKAEGREISAEEAKEPATREEDAPVYRFDSKELNTGLPGTKVAEPLNQFVTDLFVRAKDNRGELQKEDFHVNDVRFVVSCRVWKDTEDMGMGSFSVSIPETANGVTPFAKSFNADGNAPGLALLTALRDLAAPGKAKSYADNTRWLINRAKEKIQSGNDALAKRTEFAREKEYRESIQELSRIYARIRAAKSKPQNHRYFRSLKRLIGEDDTRHALGIGMEPGFPEHVDIEVWQRLAKRMRVSRYGIEINTYADAIELLEFIRAAIARDIAAAGQDQDPDLLEDAEEIEEEAPEPRSWTGTKLFVMPERNETPQYIQIRRQIARLEKALAKNEKQLPDGESLALGDFLPDQSTSSTEPIENGGRNRIEAKIEELRGRLERMEITRAEQMKDSKIPFGYTRDVDGTLHAAPLPDLARNATRIRNLQRSIDKLYEQGRDAQAAKWEAKLEIMLEQADTDMEGRDEGEDMEGDAHQDSSFMDPEAELVNMWHRWQRDDLPRRDHKTFGAFARAGMGDTPHEFLPGVTDKQIEAGAREAADHYARRRNAMKGGLKAAPLPEVEDLDTFKRRGRAAFEGKRRLIENAEEQMAAFGSGSMGVDPKFANFGGANQNTRDKVDIVRAYDMHERAVRSDRANYAAAREMLAKDEQGIEELLLEQQYSDRPRRVTDADQLAIEMLIQKRAREAGGDRQKQIDLYTLIHSNIHQRRETARLLRIGFDKFMSREDRAVQQIADSIYKMDPHAEEKALSLPPSERKKFVESVATERIDKIEAELRKVGLRLDAVLGRARELRLANSKLTKEILKMREKVEQETVKMVQKGATLADIRRRLGREAADKAQEAVTAVRDGIAAKLREMLAKGMTREEIRDAMKDGLKAAPLPGGSPMDNAAIDALVELMLEEDFGLPAVIPAKPLPKTPRTARTPGTPAVSPQQATNSTTAGPQSGTPMPPVHPLTADWNRPVFTDGMKSFTFDAKDRAKVMELVEAIKGLAGAKGRIDALSGDQRAKGEALLRKIDSILGKYGTDSQDIFDAGLGIDTYGFDPSDVAQVAAVVRIINSLDSDWIDKGTEYLYASMLSGLQTMLVNATALVPAIWESTVGRGINLAINSLLNDPMSEQWGEAKYILRGIAPAITRAKSNFRASMASQHPMFDMDVNGAEIDWDKILGGGSTRMVGSIGGRKGDIIRLPMRLLTATDDFNRTLLACAEVGTFAYRIAKAKGLKPGTQAFDRFIAIEVNTPGSFSYKLASQKASQAIFSNPLPGQKDPHTGKPVPVNDIGDLVGFIAGKITSTVAAEHHNMFTKLAAALFRISFFPFQRTPFNIMRKGMRYTPNPISAVDIVWGLVTNSRGVDAKGNPEWQWNANGRNPELITRMGQQLQGAILMALMMATGAGEGDDDDMKKPFIITGSSPFTPQGRAEREAKARSGIGPFRFSFRRADGTERFGFNYGRIEPLATTLSATIDTIKSVKRTLRGGGDAGQAMENAALALFSQAQDKTFMRGIGDLTDLLTNAMATPDLRENRKWQQFIASRVAMVMPNIIRQPVREMDPTFRDRSSSFMEELLYQTLPAGQKPEKTDPYGRTATKTGTWAGRIIDPSDAGTDKVHPVDEMLIKWSDKNPDKKWFPQSISSAKFKHKTTGKEVEMNPAQLAEFRKQSATRFMTLLKSQNVNTENPTELDVAKVRETLSRARSDAKQMLSFRFSRQ